MRKKTFNVRIKITRVIDVLVEAENESSARINAENLEWDDEQEVETIDWRILEIKPEG